MRHSVEHLFALDVACGGGLEVEIDGKAWTFSPLSFRDARKVIVRARSDAVRAYTEGTQGQKIGSLQRNMDLNAILFGTAPQEALTDPATRLYQLELSLRTTHTKETDAEIREAVDKVCETEEGAVLIAAARTMSYGPFTNAELTADEGGAENPTEPSTEVP